MLRTGSVPGDSGVYEYCPDGRTHIGTLTPEPHRVGKDNEVTDLKGKVSAALSPLGITGPRTPAICLYCGIPEYRGRLRTWRDNLMLMELKSALALGIYETFETGISEASSNCVTVFATYRFLWIFRSGLCLKD